MSNKKYYWLKLKDDFFEQDEIKIIEDMDNGKDYIIFYMKMLLKSVKTGGELRFKDTIPYSDKMLSTVTGVNVDIVRSAVKVFTELGLIEVWEDKTLYMNEVVNMVGSETSVAKRVRQHRERKKEIENQCDKPPLLHCNSDETKGNTEIEKDIEKEIEIERDTDKDNKPINKNSKPAIIDRLTNNGVSKDLAEEVWDYRKNIAKSQLTDRALSGIINNCSSNNFDLSEALILMMENGWKGFKAEWVANQVNVQQRANLAPTKAQQVSDHNDLVLEQWKRDRGLM